MEKVKRYWVLDDELSPKELAEKRAVLANTLPATEVVEVVLASSYDALAQRCERLEATLAAFQQAVGLASTCVPDMVIDVVHPVEMVQQVVAKFTTAEARVKFLEEENAGLKQDRQN